MASSFDTMKAVFLSLWRYTLSVAAHAEQHVSIQSRISEYFVENKMSLVSIVLYNKCILARFYIWLKAKWFIGKIKGSKYFNLEFQPMRYVMMHRRFRSHTLSVRASDIDLRYWTIEMLLIINKLIIYFVKFFWRLECRCK